MLCYQTRPTSRRTAHGITQPVYASVRAVLKTDGLESPYCVYNELVAARLAGLLRLPVATGVPTVQQGTLRYASLVAATPRSGIPMLAKWRAPGAALHYPEDAAALVAFDVFIGNWDRGENLKVNLDTRSRYFCAFDHSHALLAVKDAPQDSIQALRSHQLLVSHHPFYGHVTAAALDAGVQRIRELPGKLVHEACCFGVPINTVDLGMQLALADALLLRKSFLTHILSSQRRTVIGI